MNVIWIPRLYGFPDLENQAITIINVEFSVYTY